MKAPLDVEALARESKKAARILAIASTEVKNRALTRMAEALGARKKEILEANKAEAAAAKAAGRTAAYIERLTLDESRIVATAQTLARIASLPDPVGRVTDYAAPVGGLKIQKMRVPLGVVAVLYEGRPSTPAEAAALCLKSGNALILRGEPETARTDTEIVSALQEGLRLSGLPLGSIGLAKDFGAKALDRFLGLSDWIDLVIPRASHAFAAAVRQKTTIPVLAHEKGLCHIFVDEGADPGMAEAVCYGAKVDQPGASNSMETLLLHEKIAPELLPRLSQRYRRAGVELRGCPKTIQMLPGIKPATVSDWDIEYLDLILSIKIVRSLQEAVQHIAHHGSGLAEAIITNDTVRSERFLREVDAGVVLVNASTRLADGEDFGMGAELGISTRKFHARGPIGMEALTCEKFIARGTGNVRSGRRVGGA